MLAGAGLSALAVCILVAVGTVSQRRPVALEGAEDPLPSISSACIYGNEECVIAIHGGSLKLSDFKFPKGDDEPGTATASGYINGQFVSGEVDLNMAKPTRDAYWASGKNGIRPQNAASTYNGPIKLKSMNHATSSKVHKAKAHKTVKLNAEPAAQEPAGTEDEKDVHDKEYQLALKAVESRIFAREKKVEEEAKKIAEAVTRVITSPAVTEKVASIAMKAAAIKQKEQAVGGAKGLGSAGTNQFGFAAQPAGASQGPPATKTSTLVSVMRAPLFIRGVRVASMFMCIFILFFVGWCVQRF